MSDPLVNIAMTLTEPFPIGVAVTCVSAIALRKKSVA